MTIMIQTPYTDEQIMFVTTMLIPKLIGSRFLANTQKALTHKEFNEKKIKLKLLCQFDLLFVKFFVCEVTACVFLFTVLAFILYNYVVEQRQKIVFKSAGTFSPIFFRY
jgi:hypothetical protein